MPVATREGRLGRAVIFSPFGGVVTVQAAPLEVAQAVPAQPVTPESGARPASERAVRTVGAVRAGGYRRAVVRRVWPAAEAAARPVRPVVGRAGAGGSADAPVAPRPRVGVRVAGAFRVVPHRPLSAGLAVPRDREAAATVLSPVAVHVLSPALAPHVFHGSSHIAHCRHGSALAPLQTALACPHSAQRVVSAAAGVTLRRRV